MSSQTFFLQTESEAFDANDVSIVLEYSHQPRRQNELFHPRMRRALLGDRAEAPASDSTLHACAHPQFNSRVTEQSQ